MEPTRFQSEPYASLRTQAQCLAAQLEPISVRADSSHTVDAEVRQLLATSGLSALTVPAAYGGRLERVDPYAICVVREVLMSVCSHADSLFALQGIGSYAITVAGSPEQRSTWLPRVANLEALAALALTEPEAGSDLKAVTTRATESADGSVILDGTKSFISNAGAASFYTVLAREAGGLSLFLTPADSPGLHTTPAPELAAAHVLGDVVLDSVRLPASARIGQPGAAMDLVLSTLGIFRVSVAAAAIGLAQTALDEAVRHANKREQFGKPLIRLGAVSALLADSNTDLTAARLMTYRAAELAAEDSALNLQNSSMAKLFASEACARVVDRCTQVMGRWGLIHNSRIERCYRQARPMRVYEGSSEVLKLGIARELSQLAG